jgi:hypothetical protein
MTTATYAARRARLAEHLGAQGLALLPTAPEQQRNRDADFPYRFDSYFHYLCGFSEPGAWLLITGSGRSISAEVFDDAFAEPSSSTRGNNGSGAGSAASSVKGMSLSGGREADAAATAAATAPGSAHKRSTSNASVASAASTGSAGSSGASGGTPAKAKPPAPVGDDFFKTFGV